MLVSADFLFLKKVHFFNLFLLNFNGKTTYYLIYLDLMFPVAVNWLLTSDLLFQKALHDVLSFRKETDGITVDIAFQWYALQVQLIYQS